ncbi:MAG TPA: hypothetical protein DEO65_04525 [Bacillus bacterium]|nr:hypothetical protein [Bacillus sp. (in: firmicutes)]
MIFRRYLTQVLIFLFELLIIVCLGSYFFEGSFFSLIKNIRNIEMFEKITVILVIYEIIVFAFLSLYDSSRKDALLSKITMINYGISSIDHDEPFEYLTRVYEKFTKDDSIFFNTQDLLDITDIKAMYDSYCNNEISKNEYRYFLNVKLTQLHHVYEYYDLTWRMSLLLRLFK